jgi:hypothetical protein
MDRCKKSVGSSEFGVQCGTRARSPRYDRLVENPSGRPDDRTLCPNLANGIVNLLTDARLNAQYVRIAKLSGKLIQHRRARHAFRRFEGLGA